MFIEEKNINKENLDTYFKELAKEYRKLIGKKMNAEIILIGGAAIIESYDFRDMTNDIDAIINASSAIKDAINTVGDKYNLPKGWINTDFQRTSSYSNKLLQYSIFYKTYYHVLDIRIVKGEYLIAMKLRAFRKYKNDLSDIVGIVMEHYNNGDIITMDRVEKAVLNLYDSWDEFPVGAKNFITNLLSNRNYRDIFNLTKQNEKEAKDNLLEFDKKYPEILKESNVDNILQNLKKRNDKK